jgi:hypothetical protein
MLEEHFTGKCKVEKCKKAKLQLLHTPSLHIASPLHVKRRNQEEIQAPTSLREAEHQVS